MFSYLFWCFIYLWLVSKMSFRYPLYALFKTLWEPCQCVFEEPLHLEWTGGGYHYKSPQPRSEGKPFPAWMKRPMEHLWRTDTLMSYPSSCVIWLIGKIQLPTSHFHDAHRQDSVAANTWLPRRLCGPNTPQTSGSHQSTYHLWNDSWNVRPPGLWVV